MSTQETVNLPDEGARPGPAPFVLQRPDCDNEPRVAHGFRFERLFEERCDAYARAGDAGRAAVDIDGKITTFGELDRMANRMARHLVSSGVRPGDRIAILLAGTPETYAAMLAVMKAQAAFVPLDASFPADRIAYIVEDAGVTVAITTNQHAERMPQSVRVVAVDRDAETIAVHQDTRLGEGECGSQAGDLCYIIYTSGTTGRPKGVQIEHRAFANFAKVAVETYGIRPSARMYQGLTIAFDFSVEEIWVPLLSGATLVPAPVGVNLVGQDLADFISARRITALCCVPTLLATIEREIAALEFLLVSGEACPADLIKRWSRKGRRFLNAYGPTEATVTATLAVAEPDRPVTIGQPLPTYAIVILDPEIPVALARGSTGEIAIAGVGLSSGYLNRPDLTDRAFIDDFLNIAGNTSRKLYRTGDLGRINTGGEVEYLGRIDTQVKIRGYRIELTEIESVLMQTPGVAQAVVEKYQPQPGVTELVAYYTERDGASVTPARMLEHARLRLPNYMTPAYYERLGAIPMLPSNKADRKNLPKPTSPRVALASGIYEPPETQTEKIISDALARALSVEQVSVRDHFFDDLGANSLMIAHVCAAIRKSIPGARVAMRDMYAHPNVRAIAGHLDAVSATPHSEPRAARSTPHVASDAAYALCGLGQAAAFFSYLWLISFLAIEAFDWAAGATSTLEVYLRSVTFGIGAFLTLTGVPIALKWLLIGRWRPSTIDIWSADYLRFWIVKSALRTNPMIVFAGTPIYATYLRLLGARIGRDTVILASQLPLATDLVSIGDRAIVRKDVNWLGYRAEAGRIEVGSIAIGRDAYIGEASVLDIDTVVGDGAELGHASCVPRGGRIPANASRHGSPIAETADRFRTAPDGPPPSLLVKVAYTAVQFAQLFLVVWPLPIFVIIATHDLATDDSRNDLSWLANPLFGSLVLYLVPLLVGLAAITTLPRLTRPFLVEDTAYPLYGVRYAIMRSVARMTNSTIFNVIFGDSSYILYYLRAVGYRISLRGQTGSNFGLVQRHDNPYACEVGEGTLISDGLSMSNLDVSTSSFAVRRASIGTGNFLGNSILIPAHSKAGNNCLLGTKVMVPTQGAIRENVGLLGSPAFEIPRSVKRDLQFEAHKAPGEFEKRLAAKNRSNLVTIAIYLASRWLLFLAAWFYVVAAFNWHGVLGSLAAAAALFAMAVTTSLYFVLLERLSLRFDRLEPKFCSIYDPYYWGHERYWKINDTTFITTFDGTPVKPLLWRMLGVRVGAKLFDDGCSMTERTLVSIGDNCTLNALSTLQSHSLEDGAFKSGHVRLGNGCTIGTKAYISYEAVIEDGATVEPDSFLMKGETVSAGSVWQGNPAREVAG